jgi:lipoate---protein ligase
MTCMTKPTIHLLECDNLPIYQQLQVEEALLRVSEENWCVLNSGSPLSIVMGISGRMNELLHTDKVTANKVPVIQRFSGGGTVVVDQNTLFASFIINQHAVDVRSVPDQVHCWAKGFYQHIFTEGSFQLRENDYVFGEKKFGGNAQYLRKDRWLHHTTFLWDFDAKNMGYLKIPGKAPKYRNGRDHGDFLCQLNSLLSSKEVFFERVFSQLSACFVVKRVSFREITPILNVAHRKATKIVV